MTDQSVMDPGDSERERLLHQVAHLQRELATARQERDEARAKHDNLVDEIQDCVDRVVYYRNLAIHLGAKPGHMQGRFDLKLCEDGFAAGDVDWLFQESEETWRDLERAEDSLNEACGWAMWAGMLMREYSTLLAVIELHSPPDGECSCRFRDECLVEIIAAARAGVQGETSQP